MSIRVTCTGCHTRFNVSEKFAGKEGPCPKCKKTILIPAASETVEVHGPREFGPEGITGKAVFKPIVRQHARLTPVQWVLTGATIAGFLALAFLMKAGVSDKDEFSSWVLLVAAVILAIPSIFAGYAFLRDGDLGGFQGRELWTRIFLCALVYGIGWLAIPAITYAMGGGIGTAIGVTMMFVIGSTAAFLLLGIDIFMSILHYGMFFGFCILLRVIAGFAALPPVVESGGEMDDLLNAAGDKPLWIESLGEVWQMLV